MRCSKRRKSIIMKVLVTGGAGYIGSVLVPMLLSRGYEVTVIDNFLYKQASLLDCCHDPNLQVVRGDTRDRDLISRYIKDVDIIIPLAAIVGAPICDRFPIEAKTTNLEAIKLILELRGPLQKIIFPNTNSGYGIGKADVYFTEESTLKPISLYGRLKVEAERLILEKGNAIVFRLATVFGASPRMRVDLLVNDFVYHAVHDGGVVLFEPEFKRNYIHIRDVGRAFLHAIDNFEAMKNHVYNIGLSDANLNKRELCEEIKKHLPNFQYVVAPIGEDKDKRNYIVSNEKIEKTGFRPQFSLSDGIKELVKGYQIIKNSQFGNY